MKRLNLDNHSPFHKTGHTSKGDQRKWKVGDRWYKADYMGYESHGRSSGQGGNDYAGIIYRKSRDGISWNICQKRWFRGWEKGDLWKTSKTERKPSD